MPTWLFALMLSAAAAPPDPQAVHVVLDGFHQAAAVADDEAYFGAMTEDGVFLGTDATERWTRDDFRAWAAPHFEGDSAWRYTPTTRHLSFSRDGRTAWFDEVLQHARYGTVRGSGVVVRQRKTWRIAQYVLSFPIPNDVAGEVLELVQSHETPQRPTHSAP